MKTITIIMVLLLGFFTSMNSQTATPPSSGNGSLENPYHITSLNNLYWIAAPAYVVSSPSLAARCGYHYIQTANINASATSSWEDEFGWIGWKPIGEYNSTPFTGVYDGNGYIITGLTINPAEWLDDYMGLFSYVNGGEIKNLGLISGSVNAGDYSGSLVGYLVNGTIANCFSSNSVDGETTVGGLIGWSQNSTITSSHTTGNVLGWGNVGGLIGYCYHNSVVENSYATGNISGWTVIGGLIGRMVYSTVTKNYASGNIQTYSSSVSNDNFGGFVGYIDGFDGNTILENNYALGNVTGIPQGAYTQSNYIGGFVGQNYQGIIKNCYSIGAVSGTYDVGGFSGAKVTGGTYLVSDCFWNIETSGRSVSADGTGKTTVEMKLLSTFTNWDFATPIWKMENTASYPFLEWQVVNNLLIEKNINSAGTVSGEGQYPPNFLITISAIANVGYSFLNWTKSGGGTFGNSNNSTTTFRMPSEEVTITANFVSIFAGGLGTEQDPWKISSASHLDYLRNFVGDGYADKHFIILNDLDLAPYLLPGENGYNNGAFWQPIGDFTDQFHGKLNGDGYKVAYLKVNREATDYIGLFGVIGSNGKVENLGVEVVTSTLVNGNNYVGSIVGCNYGTLENIYAIGEGTIKGNQDVGGLAGSNEGTIKTSYSTSIVEGIQNVGGFVGTNINATIENCYSRSDVTRTSETNTNFGAFCGNNDNSTIKFSYCTGSVSYEFPTFPSDKGFIGNSVGSSYLGNFFDNQISNQSTATGATGNTTIEMTNSTSTNNIYLNAGWDFKGESNNGTQSIWNIGHGRNDTYPYQSIFYTNDPPSINTIQSTHSLPIGNSSPAPITFTGTGVTIDFSGVSGATGADDITISKYNEAPTVLTGAIGSEINIAGTSYLFTNNSGFTFTSTIQFLVSDIPGVNTALLASLNNGDATDIKFWKRPEYGSGEFTNLGFLLYNKGLDDINGTADDYLYLGSITSFSEFTFSSGTHVLPVELTSFIASVSERKVTLNWQTATEINNYGFDVERLAVSVQRAIVSGQRTDKWEVIGFVEGHGNCNSSKEYSFIDDNLMSGKYSYRLKQIDNDGNFSYSEIVNVKIGELPTIFELSQNYPNPFNPKTRIKYSIPANHSHSTLRTVSLKVYDILGNEIVTLVNEVKAPGYYQVEWNATGFATGVYFYSLHAGTFTSVKKLILLR